MASYGRVLMGSLVATSATVWHAFYQKKQFYPAMVHVANSNLSVMVRAGARVDKWTTCCVWGVKRTVSPFPCAILLASMWALLDCLAGLKSLPRLAIAALVLPRLHRWRVFLPPHPYSFNGILLPLSPPQVLYLQVAVLGFGVAKLFQRLFFGRLRASEREHLVTNMWISVTETLLAMTIFRDEFNSFFVALFGLLLVCKAFHWLTQDRVDFVSVCVWVCVRVCVCAPACVYVCICG